jgi:hypothetical protein
MSFVFVGIYCGGILLAFIVFVTCAVLWRRRYRERRAREMLMQGYGVAQMSNGHPVLVAQTFQPPVTSYGAASYNGGATVVTVAEGMPLRESQVNPYMGVATGAPLYQRV